MSEERKVTENRIICPQCNQNSMEMYDYSEDIYQCICKCGALQYVTKNHSINHPAHYNQGNIEVIDFIEDQNFDFLLGNAIKYICRCRHKGKPVEDIEKAIWYLKKFSQKAHVEKVKNG